ncbi:MAG: glutamate-5-semialdehyde dehydrogenase [Gammaproteobacteria bacterium]|nr:glutamate-5-semialdehyde dehydrogenase [Gammaproteobacteria bacterium]
MTDLETTMLRLGTQAQQAARRLALASTTQKNEVLQAIAKRLNHGAEQILKANHGDVAAAAEKGLSDAMLDRLRLDPERISAMVDGVTSIALLDDPIGQTIASWDRPNGLGIERRRVPLGVIGIIYESRPNVTADAAALCLKSGNGVILRGGTESFHTNRQIYALIQEALSASGLPVECVQMVPTADRDAVGLLLSGLDGCVDLLVPRGGKNLIRRVQEDARVPVMGHLEGICHVYIDNSADIQMAKQIVVNAKMRRTGICGAAETVLLDGALAPEDQRAVIAQLLDAGCEIRGDEAVCALDTRVVPARDSDWGCEFLGPIMAARMVDGVRDAARYISKFGSGHTESIVAQDSTVANVFLDTVDSAIVMHNASTQFADGGEFGMGAEIGIATGKVHARGPVGVEQLTSYKYIVRGNGQIRPG